MDCKGLQIAAPVFIWEKNLVFRTFLHPIYFPYVKGDRKNVRNERTEALCPARRRIKIRREVRFVYSKSILRSGHFYIPFIDIPTKLVVE